MQHSRFDAMAEGPSKLAQLDARLAELRRATERGFTARAEELRAAASALESGDPQGRLAIGRLAHKLRGIAGSVGHARLGERAALVEDEARVGSDGPALCASARALAEDALEASARALTEAAGETNRHGSAQRSDASAPMTSGAAPSAERAASSGMSRASAPTLALGWRVVALDDESATRRLLEITLRQAGGCDATVVEAPAEALELARREGVDLVIVDAMMPDTNGLAFYREVRAAAGDALPVAILSAATPEELGWTLPDDPRLCWLRKPFRPAALIAALRVFVGE